MLHDAPARMLAGDAGGNRGSERQAGPSGPRSAPEAGRAGSAGGAPLPQTDARVDVAPADADAGAVGDKETGMPSSSQPGAPASDGGFCSACDSAPLATPVLNDSGGSGNVTTLGASAPSEGGACNYGKTSIAYFASINVDVQASDARGQWQAGKICGQCAAVRVKTASGWKQTVVRIMDKCSGAYCGIALAGKPAGDLMGQQPGRYDGDWRFVSCEGHPEASDGPALLHVKEGSSKFWALVQVRNPAHAVTGIDWKSPEGASGSFPYAAEAENYFSVPEAVRNLGMVQLTVHYRDKTRVELDVSVSQLTTADANIGLP
jgi:expansin (peptidoglycan-binding protein)